MNQDSRDPGFDPASEPSREGGGAGGAASRDPSRGNGPGRAPAAAASADLTDEEREALASEVRDLVTALLKSIRAHQTYVAGNPLIDKFQGQLAERFERLWDRLPHLSLAVDEGRLLWQGEAVYEKELGADNFAFRFFRDGIRALAFFPGAEDRELEAFVEVVTGRGRGRPVDDLVAELWHRDFSNIRMEYVDVAEEEGLELPQVDRQAGAGERIEDTSEIEEAVASGPLTPEETAEFADLALGDPDLAYLRREMEAEWSRPLTRDVTLALLDQFEMRDEERRRQVVDILREFLPRLLKQRDFANVALIVNELQLLANKTGEAQTQELVASLLRDMSEAMAEMVSAAERSGEGPEGDELTALLSALQAEAIPTLVRAIPAVPQRSTRRRLIEALDRLVAANPGQIIGLLQADDPVLAAEAARIVGRLRVKDAEPQLIELARRPEQVTRQAAIEALTALGSLAGREALSAALADDSREVRLAAVNAVSELRPEGAGQMLRAWITSSEMEDRDRTEQMAFFKAYATTAGEAGVPVLAKLLNRRRWWGGRRPSSIRTAAARALGFIDSEAARTALRKAEGDRTPPVRSAVRVALRELSADPVDDGTADDLAGPEPRETDAGDEPGGTEAEEAR